MPDSRRHRSAGPADRELFAPSVLPRLVEAVRDLSWLLSRGYAERSALELVGNRHQLARRQRVAVGRSACSDGALASRRVRRAEPRELEGAALAVDGYNLLATVEVALGGGALLRGRDGCLRDLASLHGTWRRVEETEPAVELATARLAELGLSSCAWLLDAPVSNSGRLAALLRSAAERADLAAEVALVPDADAAVLASGAFAVSADRRVLDGCGRWLDLASDLIPARVPGAWIVDLGGEGTTG